MGDEFVGVGRQQTMAFWCKQMLNSQNCRQLKNGMRRNSLCQITDNFFEFMPKLRVLDLSLNWSLSHFSVVEDSVQCGGNELLIKELQLLKSLISLRVSIKSASAFERFLASKNLVSCTQALFLQHLSGLHFLKLSSLIDLKLLDEFVICHCTSLEIDWGWERLRHSMITGAGYFQKLGRVRIEHCHKLKDLTWLIFAPNLNFLWIEDCSALEEIIHLNKLGDGQEVTKHLDPFVKLKTLYLFSLPSLKSISGKPLPCLKTIIVRKCAELKKLPISSEITKIQNLTIRGEESWWNELEWEDVATRDTFLPCFQANHD
ncbi:hypothetical protein TIFTF001_053021 [Ficus carica]|uniref:Disease resistance protein At4g27190-like leucine-rich repeats domain-containing protein n=1 Tax=Ficus carica TaxID=3494 RepID=A0AA88EEK5_FICCA|nr:hypothetical protein TIFTF001_053021 [Ficus carica]